MDQQFATDWLRVACPVYKVKDSIKSIKFCHQWFKIHRKIYYQVKSAHAGSANVDCASVKRFNLTLFFTIQHYMFASTI